MNKAALLALLRLEGATTISVVVLGVIAGEVFGHPLVGLALALGGLLAVQLWYAAHLRLWQQSPKANELPAGYGIWESIYDDAYMRYRQARKRKKRLAAILKEFRASTGALPDAAVVLDKSARITWFNAAANRMLGFQTSRDVGQRVANLIRNPDFLHYLESDDSAPEGVEIPSLENPENTLWVRLVPYGKSQRLLIARDITDRKRIEQMRRDFVSNASHELRTPLTVVSGYLEMLVAEADLQAPGLESWAQPLREMRRQSARMESIIKDMLKLARLEASSRVAEREPIHMSRLLRDATKEAQALSEGRHTIQAEVDEELGLAGQPAEIQSIVGNLLSNAVRYTPDGGEIFLRWYADEEGRWLEVRDTGIGIDPRDLPRLTERFYRADVARSRETGGTGLGLAIVKHALERHDAVLHVRSEQGAGSCFRCQFPK